MTAAKSSIVRSNRVFTQFFRRFFTILLCILLIGIITCVILYIISDRTSESSGNEFAKFSLGSLLDPPEVTVSRVPTVSKLPPPPECHYYNCFDVYKCGKRESTSISVYIYPPQKFVDEDDVPVTTMISQEFQDISKAIYHSRFYTANPEEACIFIPVIDFLNQNHVRLKQAGWALAQLPYWNGGQNHLLFNMLPGGPPDYQSVLQVKTGAAMVAGGGFSTLTYRQGFDVSLPVFNPLVTDVQIVPNKSHMDEPRWFLISSQINIHAEHKEELEILSNRHNEFIVLDHCIGQLATNYSVRCYQDSVYEYPHILQNASFCLVIRGARLGQPVLLEAMMAGCIPVIVADSYVMPFSEIIDWKRSSVRVHEEDLPDLMDILHSITKDRIREMKHQMEWLYRQYFATLPSIILTTLEIINARVFPHTDTGYHHWNTPTFEPVVHGNPLFLPLTASKSQGFTAVILTYDRLESLFQVIQKVVKAPSLSKVLVVWNNQKKLPPHPSIWPKINKPLKVVQTTQNKLSNRFYPYEEIETEAVLAIDDDIIMLTADELEFGFEVWREFPDRIVGFPSRTHVWDNMTMRWKYESEWTNEISMVLTGAAFYHKYWSYLYTTSMPGDIKTWVDTHMNCEDIAMNFLVANITGKAPVKVAPKKKFKCPECVNNEMLSADLSHMIERSHCINRFAAIYGTMPLKTVEFRADPVLYKDNFPEKLKRFHDIGNL